MMETKKYIVGGLIFIGVAVILSFFINRKDNSLNGYVAAFCSCVDEYAPQKSQYESGRLDKRSYDEAVLKHKNCLGERNPFSNLSEADSIVFLRDFIHAVRLECPESAEKAGFKIR
jgi:hypothetical protein